MGFFRCAGICVSQPGHQPGHLICADPSNGMEFQVIGVGRCFVDSSFGWLVGGWVGWVGLGWVGLGWVGLGWVGLGWVGLGWLVGWLVF